MKILIAGLSKTGTTALYSLINEALPGHYEGLFEPKVYKPKDDRNVLCKVLLGPRLNLSSFSAFDKRITIVRDIRDRLISILLYQQFHAPYLKDSEAVRRVTDCLVEKESSPSSVCLLDILNLISEVSDDPDLTERFFKRVVQAMSDFDDYVAKFKTALLYHYEDLIRGQFHPLEQYLDIRLPERISIPSAYKRVIRTKAEGNWRNWLTQRDVSYLKPQMSAWLTQYGYDGNDWELNESPSIAPQHCSKYFVRLVEEANGKLTKS